MSRRNHSGSEFMANVIVAGFCFGIYGLVYLVKFLAKMFLIGGALKWYGLEEDKTKVKETNNKEEQLSPNDTKY